MNLKNRFHLPSHCIASLLVLCLPLNNLHTQTRDFFYRAWAQRGATVAPGYNNTVSAVSESGETYLATSILNSSNTYSMSLSQYSDLGVLLWAAVFEVDTAGNAYAGGIALDPSGNVFVAGSAYNGATAGYDLFTVKYSSSGTKLWQQLYNGPGSLYDFGSSVVCDSNGDVYVTGSAMQSFVNADALTLKYSSSGNLEWDKTWDNAGHSDAGGAILVTSAQVDVSGLTQTSSDTWEYAALRYDPSNGELLSSEVTDQGGTSIDRISAAIADASGNIYVTGAFGTSGEGLNIKTIKFAPDLSIAWMVSYDGTAHLDDAGRSVVVDALGNVYVAGYTTAAAANRDAILLKYSASGTLNWVRICDGAARNDEFSALSLTAEGEPFAGGYTTLHDNKDFYATLYGSSGVLRWSETYNGFANLGDEIQQITPDGQGNFIAAGPSGGWAANAAQLLAIKYARHTLTEPQSETVAAAFIEERGQSLTTDSLPVQVSDLRYFTRSTYPSVYIFDDKISYVYAHIDSSVATVDTMVRLDLTFPGARSRRTAVGLSRQETFHNYYFGHIPEGRERVPLENKVLIPDLYPDIDALYG